MYMEKRRWKRKTKWVVQGKIARNVEEDSSNEEG